MAVSRAELIDCYLAYFGRAPDAEGLRFYSGNPAMTIEAVVRGFGASPESRGLHGDGFGTRQLDAIYRQLFNRDAEPAAQAYWLGEVAAGRVTAAGAALAILRGAQNADRLAVQHKVQLVDAFLDRLAGTDLPAGFSEALALSQLHLLLQRVGDSPASLQAALGSLGTIGITASPSPPTGGDDGSTVDPPAAALALAEHGSGDLADGILNRTEAVTTTFRITLPPDRGAVGDTLELLLDGKPFDKPVLAVLKADHLEKGASVDFTVGHGDLGADGAKQLSARLLPLTGDTVASNVVAFTLSTVPPSVPTDVTLSAVGGTVVAHTVNTTNTHLVGAATIVAGQATGGRAELYVDTVRIAQDTTILAGDTAVTFDTSDGSPTPAELQALVTVGGKVTVRLVDASGEAVSSGIAFQLARDFTPPGAPSTPFRQPGGREVVEVGASERAAPADVQVTVRLGTSGAVEGDTLELLLGGAGVATPLRRELTPEDIAQSAVDVAIGASALGAAGAKLLSARVTDAAGNAGPASAPLAFTLDAEGNWIPKLAGVRGILSPADGTPTADPGDRLVMTFSTTVGNTADVDAQFQADRFGTAGTRATIAWALRNTELTVTLGEGETFDTGGTVRLVGVQDAFGAAETIDFQFTVGPA